MKRSFFTPRWIITTALVIAAVLVMVRLGIWQLDRLAQRRAFNARVEAQVNAAPLDLNKDFPIDQLAGMEYRSAVVSGTYDFSNEVLLRNQVYNSRPGYHLLTPLHIAGSQQSVLVDRGFIPINADLSPVDRKQYDQPSAATVKGIVRLPHVPQFFGVPDPTLAPGQARLDAWNAVNLPRIQAQVPYPLLRVYVEVGSVQSAQSDGSGDGALSSAQGNIPGTGPLTYPVPNVEQLDRSEGPHMGYAIQWFSFAAILALGYPYFVRKQLNDVPLFCKPLNGRPLRK